MRRSQPRRRRQGLAAVELALLLPVLLALLFGMIDAARVLQASIIVTNIGREGANLAARDSTPLETGSQDLIHALMASAPPLDVEDRGMMIITRVMGVVVDGVPASVALAQFRWDDPARGLGYRASRYAPASRVVSCPAWSDGRCSGIDPAAPPRVAIMSGQLKDGEVVYAVEAFYRYDPVFTRFAFGGGALPDFAPDLYSLTVF